MKVVNLWLDGKRKKEKNYERSNEKIKREW